MVCDTAISALDFSWREKRLLDKPAVCSLSQPHPSRSRFARLIHPLHKERGEGPLNRQHLDDSSANILAFLRPGTGIETDIIRYHRRAFQHHDAVADLERFADRMGDEHGGLAVLLYQSDEFGAQP